MFRFCLMGWVLILFAFGSFGCTGQDVEGMWRGGLPFEDQADCMTRMQNNHSFTFTCGGKKFVGGGYYTWDGARLNLHLTELAVGGQLVRRSRRVIGFHVIGHGNQMTLTRNGTVYTWRRAWN